MSPPQKRCCHFCYTSFLIQDIDSDGAVPPRVIACTQCGKRWREKSFIRDDGRLHTILEEVDDDVRLTTRSLVEDNKTLESQYHSRCIKLAAELDVLLGKPRTIFLRMVAEHGAVAATKRLVHSKKPSPTFTELVMNQRFALTVEAIIISEPEWEQLFDDSDRAAARKRLLEHGWKPSA